MKTYTQEEIDNLIACHKVIIDSPKREMKLINGSKRNDMKVKSKDSEDEFSVFMRQNEKFPENFSIGLRYLPRDDESICLLRCNGVHGEHKNYDNTMLPNVVHIHKAKAEAIKAERRAENYAELTDKYFTYEEALIYFMKITNTEGAKKYFSSSDKQLELFESFQKENDDQ